MSICARPYPNRPAILCDRPDGHTGPHRNGAGNGTTRWGGAGRDSGTYERVRPLPAGKQLAPHKAPAAPSHAKFKDTPGQQMLSLDDDDPQRLEPR